MAALGTIRKRGVILVCIISFGLFAFIAEEAFRSCDSAKNNERQQIGEVFGEKISVQEFQKLVDEYTEVIKMQQGQDNLPEEQMNQVKDMVWNSYIQNKIVAHEAEKLGLTVTDAELQDILKTGTSPMLAQTPFVNQQTGRFDVSALQKFLADYKAQKANPSANAQMMDQYTKIYNYWSFIEKTLRQQTLAQKYQSLLAHCFLSNPVEAKMAFKEENEESKIQLAAFPYSDIQDDKVKVVESDLKAKYDEMKARFKQPVESRDIKFVDIQVEASQADRAALNKEFAGYHTQLAAAADPTEVVRKSASTVAYLGIPVAKDAFPSDIAATLDSMAVGATTAVKANTADNTLNIVKLVNKQQLPDSIQYRVIQVAAASVAEAKTKADSIQGAISGGADFEAIAKKYGQTGEKAWMTTRQYEFAQSMDKDNKAFINALNTQAVNATSQLQLGQGYVILQVCDRKAMIEKYTAAVIKKNVDFSQDTYRTAYNKFSSFVSANQTADEIVKNAAKSGYKVQDLKDITTATHYVANIHSTREALKWIFEAKEGSVSPMYECGNNDHLLVVVLDKINRIGFRGLDDPQVKEMVKAEVIKDKKAEMIEAKLNGVKNIAAAKSKGAKVSEVNQITFAAPVFVASVGASEPALSGAVSATKKGVFSAHPVKGNAGVYLFLVTNKSNRPVKFDEKAQEQKCRQKSMQYAGNFMNELYLNANVVDNRYLFF
ncbi:peptidylprolyl isomerase [Prevotellaceae bacterium LCP21S3_C11]|uniref:peptidylprolyl isomerase n=1 Tax=Segatella hominis TaxID=2518605 RepID=UPI001F1A5303|nr:peptidylprolyl isomerase [Segatella hominis]MBS7282713.1 SurA N-terminal domain-containing protein [Prevotella sp.]MCF2589940.1 SurA N-terminal domain-containing protein [Segatella hominis]